MNEQLRQSTANVVPQMSGGAHAFMAVFLPVIAIIGAVVFVGWILAMMSLIADHSVFGWHIPHGWPFWGAILTLLAVYLAISGLLKLARHGGPNSPRRYHPGWSALHGAMWIGFTVFSFYVAYRFFPGIRELVDNLMWAANLTVSTISETIV